MLTADLLTSLSSEALPGVLGTLASAALAFVQSIPALREITASKQVFLGSSQAWPNSVSSSCSYSAAEVSYPRHTVLAA